MLNRIGEILFHQTTSTTGTISIHSLQFGIFQGTIDTMQMISLSVDINPFYQSIGKYVDKEKPIELEDIQAIVVPEGIDVDILVTKSSFPLRILCKSIDLDISWLLKGQGHPFQAMMVSLDRFELPRVHAEATLNMDPENGSLQPLKELVLQMLTFQEFTKNARFGYLTIMGSKGERFVPFEKVLFSTPKPLYIPPPLHVYLKPYQEPLKVEMLIRNPTPVHLDLGNAHVKVYGQEGALDIEAWSNGDIIALNNKEGADPNGTDTKPPRIGEFNVQLNAFPSPFTKTNFTGIMSNWIQNTKSFNTDFQVLVELKRKDVLVTWVSQVTDYLLSNGLADELSPLFSDILTKIRLEIESPPEGLLQKNQTINMVSV
jgi:hypothetical protein